MVLEKKKMIRRFLKKSTWAIALLWLGFGCKDKSQENAALIIPSYVLAEDVFIKLTADLALAESAASLNVKNVSSQQNDSVYAFNPFKEHGIAKKQYDTSVYFYSQHPQLYKQLLEKALNRLSVLQSKKQIQ